ncbi:MAG TPA: protein translocase subunit SecD, partial [Candidatus Syntrophosphaera thermopropionivorans]|nr:protein translocase subunit SecD [Candidatus Syntrophosphaera thermopropionivorans]
MRKNSWLTPVSILIFVLGTLIFLSPLFVPEDVNWPIKQKLKLGLDLRGGTQIVLTVVTKDLPEADKAAAVENNIRIIRNRIDQFGIAEPTIQKMGESDILVQLPGVKDPIAAENLIMKSAVLEFKLVAEPDIAEKFINQVDAIIQENLDKFPVLAKLAEEDKALAKAGADSVKTGEGIFKSLITTTERDFAVRYEDLDIVRSLLQDSTFVNLKPKGYDLVLESVDEKKKASREPVVLYVLESTAQLKGTDVDRASMEIGPSDSPNPQIANKPYISLTFTRTGARKFAN